MSHVREAKKTPTALFACTGGMLYTLTNTYTRPAHIICQRTTTTISSSLTCLTGSCNHAYTHTSLLSDDRVVQATTTHRDTTAHTLALARHAITQTHRPRCSLFRSLDTHTDTCAVYTCSRTDIVVCAQPSKGHSLPRARRRRVLVAAGPRNPPLPLPAGRNPAKRPCRRRLLGRRREGLPPSSCPRMNTLRLRLRPTRRQSP